MKQQQTMNISPTELTIAGEESSSANGLRAAAAALVNTEVAALRFRPVWPVRVADGGELAVVAPPGNLSGNANLLNPLEAVVRVGNVCSNNNSLVNQSQQR